MLRARPRVAALACAITAAVALAVSSGVQAKTAARTASVKVSASTIATALKFTGGKAGKANPKLAPVTIGYVNEEASVPAFPVYHVVTQAAVNFVNNYLGGVGGHPLKLDACVLQSEEDGQKCGAELRSNSKIHVGILGLSVVGNQPFYKAVSGKFPVVVDVAATGPDSTTPDVYNLSGGGPGELNAQTQTALAASKKAHSKVVAILTTNNAAGINTADQVLVPALKKLGLTPKIVLFPDTATTPQFASALSSSGAASSGAIFFSPSSAEQCVELGDAMKQLGIHTSVATDVFCSAGSVVKALGSQINGWTFSSFGWNPQVTTGNAQSSAFANVMAAAGKSYATNDGYTLTSFADLLAIDKLANQVGFSKLTSASMKSAILKWRGPAWMQAGPLYCGDNKIEISICGSTGWSSAYENNKWVNLGPFTLASEAHK